MIKLGNEEVDIKLGLEPVVEIRLGTEVVWQQSN